MKITFSPLVASMSGRAADAVGARWKGVNYVRSYVIPKNPRTAGQVTQRGYMARIPHMFRSLPDEVVAWLNKLAVGQKMSGFNLLGREDLQHLANAEDLEIVPDNPNNNALFLLVDGTSVVADQIDVDWEAGAAIATHFVHLFTCPVDPAEVGKEEPDAWTYQSGNIELVSAGAATAIPVSDTGKDYYVAGIVCDTNDLATATVFSGGRGDTCTSG